MAKPFWKQVNDVIMRSDVILEVLDARLIDETRNAEIEEKIERQGKKLIHVVNKIDLINRSEIKDKLKTLSNPMFVSSRERLGTTLLKNKILAVGSKDTIIVGVVGYPNTGKSSVINALAGSKKARTSSTSGFTRGIQKVKASDRIMLLDSPGVYPFEEKDIVKQTLVGAKNPQELKDPDLVAMELIKILKGRIEKHYGVEILEDYEQTLENIAFKINRLKKGGLPDTISTAKTIIMEWQRGKIK